MHYKVEKTSKMTPLQLTFIPEKKLSASFAGSVSRQLELLEETGPIGLFLDVGISVFFLDC